MVLANLAPELGRREPEPRVEQVLNWAAIPLATREVAEVTQLSQREAREQLGRMATEYHIGSDGLWTLQAA